MSITTLQKHISIFNKEIPIDFYDAAVIHANKYNSVHGGFLNLPVLSTLYTDVVFRDAQTGKDIKIYIRNLDLPVYSGQNVSIFATGSQVLGFIDRQTDYYYYTTNDLGKDIGVGLSFLYSLVLALATAMLCYWLLDNSYAVCCIIIPILVWFLFNRGQKYFLQYYIGKKLDSMLQAKHP